MNDVVLRPGAPHVTDDDLLDLLHGYLDSAECRRTLEHARSCVACDARFREIVHSHERGRAQAAPVLGGPTRQAVEIPGERIPHERKRWPTRAVGWLVAAGLIAVAGVGVLSRSRDASERGGLRAEPAWLSTMAPSGLRRSAEDPADSLIMAGVGAYERRDLAGAERLLAGAVTDPSIEQLRQLYLANTLVHMNRASEALPILRQYASENVSIPEPWRGEWHWTYLAALGRVGETARADSLLRELAGRSDALGARARTLLGREHAGGRR